MSTQTDASTTNPPIHVKNLPSSIPQRRKDLVHGSKVSKKIEIIPPEKEKVRRKYFNPLNPWTWW